MQTHIDKFGRVLIPKNIRDHLGFKPGDIIQVEELNHSLILKLVENKSPLIQEDNVLVFMGQATEDLESFINTEREKRLKDLF